MANDDDESIGYGRPPKRTRFKPGQSGNPRGRPKGVRNFKTDLMSALKARVRVTRDGKTKSVSTQEAAILRLTDAAVTKGDLRALERILLLAQTYNDDSLVADAGNDLDSNDEEVLKAFMQRNNLDPQIPPDPNGGQTNKRKKR